MSGVDSGIYADWHVSLLEELFGDSLDFHSDLYHFTHFHRRDHNGGIDAFTTWWDDGLHPNAVVRQCDSLDDRPEELPALFWFGMERRRSLYRASQTLLNVGGGWAV